MSKIPTSLATGSAARGSGLIQRIIQPKPKDLGGFSVRRTLPSIGQRMIGPWVFFDHMGPAQFPAGQGMDVRPHPHIGIATVTYLFAGEILHRDSLGSVQAIVPGDLNLMVSGRGIVHSERQRAEVKARPQTLHGLQLWLALPAKDEETEPAFHHYPSADLPTFNIGGVAGRVMMGCAYGITSPVRTFSSTLYVEAHLKAGHTLAMPKAMERGVYVAQGELLAGDMHLEEHSLAVLAAEEGGSLTARQDSRIAIIGGDHLGPRHVDWNFVSSRPERVQQAKSDWVNKRFPSVPGDEVEFIPLPEQ